MKISVKVWRQVCDQQNYEGKQIKINQGKFHGRNRAWKQFLSQRLQNYFSYENSVVYEGTTFFKYRKVKKHPHPAHTHIHTHIYLYISSGEVTQSRNTEAKNKESSEAFDTFCQVAFQKL